jgi:hypothetical protein
VTANCLWAHASVGVDKYVSLAYDVASQLARVQRFQGVNDTGADLGSTAIMRYGDTALW